MDVSREDLDRAVAEGLIDSKQADGLWAAFLRNAASRGEMASARSANAATAPKSRFDFVNVAYYFGALIVIGAMGLFMTLGWESFGGAGIFAIAGAYAMAFSLAGRALWQRKDLRTPGGLLISMAVGMTPLGVYGLERALGLWPQVDPGVYRGFHEWIKGGWFAMEAATIGAGVLALRFFRFPFLTALIAFTLWYVSMDLAPLLFGAAPSLNQRAGVSTAAGLVVVIAGYIIDHRTREDFSFWLYLFGLLAFSGGLSCMQSSSELAKFGYLIVHLSLMVKSVLLRRRTFMVFGSFGVLGYLAYLAHDVFEDSLLFPFALSGLGIGIIALAVHYHRNRVRYEAALLGLVPAWVKGLLPPEHAP